MLKRSERGLRGDRCIPRCRKKTPTMPLCCSRQCKVTPLPSSSPAGMIRSFLHKVGKKGVGLKLEQFPGRWRRFMVCLCARKRRRRRRTTKWDEGLQILDEPGLRKILRRKSWTLWAAGLWLVSVWIAGREISRWEGGGKGHCCHFCPLKQFTLVSSCFHSPSCRNEWTLCRSPERRRADPAVWASIRFHTSSRSKRRRRFSCCGSCSSVLLRVTSGTSAAASLSFLCRRLLDLWLLEGFFFLASLA